MFVSFSNLNKRLDRINFSKESFKIGGYPFYVNIIATPSSDTGNFSRRRYFSDEDDNTTGPLSGDALRGIRSNIQQTKANRPMNKLGLYEDSYGHADPDTDNSDTNYRMENIEYQKLESARILEDAARKAIAENEDALAQINEAHYANDYQGIKDAENRYNVTKKQAEEIIDQVKAVDPNAGRELDNKLKGLTEAPAEGQNGVLNGIKSLFGASALGALAGPIGIGIGITFATALAAFATAKIWKKYAISTKRDKTCYAMLEDLMTGELTKTELRKLSNNNTLIRINLLKQITVYSGLKDEYASMAEADVKMFYKPKIYANKFKDLKQLKDFAKTLK